MQQELPDFFGDDDQQALLKRGIALHRLVSDSISLTYYGRTVGISGPTDAPLETLIDLTRLQGNSSYARVPPAELPGLVRDVEVCGLNPLVYARWVGREDSLHMARDIAGRPLAEGMTAIILTRDSPITLRTGLAEIALGCGVLPPNLAVLSGALKPAVCVMAVDAAGKVRACAAAASYFHPDHPEGREMCWWGMLATEENQRGKGLALHLGARAMLEMQQRFGFNAFFTGVVPGNLPSEAVCQRLGLVQEEDFILGVSDPALLRSGRMTK